MSVNSYDELSEHIGHKIVCVGYSQGNDPFQNVALECEDCGVVLVDYDRPSEDLADDDKFQCERCGGTFDNDYSVKPEGKKGPMICEGCHSSS